MHALLICPLRPLESLISESPLAMDRLRQIAHVGDTNELYKCIQEDVEVRRCLDDDDDKANQLLDHTPLHIAATRGRVDLAMALMYLKPSWGRKLNQELYSPMHLAVLFGHTELVLSLLAVDKDLVRVKGRAGCTALHFAVEKPDIVLVAQFLKDCPTCVEDVTIQNETALHVAAQYDRLIALEILARYPRRARLYRKVSKKHLLNSKDGNGNTVLHIAANKAQPQMIKVLLECGVSKKETNKGGFTASELLETQSIGTPDREFCLNITRNARWRQVTMSPKELVYFLLCRFPRDEPLHDRLRYKITAFEEKLVLMSDGIVNMSADTINALLVVLALILTATYQAMLSPPGGVWQGSYSPGTTPAGTHVGQSVMNSFFFSIFILLNLSVFCLASVFTVYFVQVVSGSNVVALLSEMLLSLLIGCLLLERGVIAPNDEPRLAEKVEDLSKIQNLTFPLLIFFVLLGMDIGRRFFQRLINPPRVRYFYEVLA